MIYFYRMRNGLVVLWVLLGTIRIGVAQNLVPNPSFEEYTQCPWTLGNLELAVPWYLANNLYPSYFNACDNATSCLFSEGVPCNNVGYQQARTGVAYAGISLFSTNLVNTRHYIAAKLTESLQQDSSYCVEFFVSLCDRRWHPINSIGLLISVDTVYDNQNDTLSYIPQIQSDLNSVLIDTVNWMRISGTYTAQGGERFITIGNFLADNQITILPAEDPAAFYYLEDVFVGRCSQVGVSVNGFMDKKQVLQIYPNPASEKIHFTLSTKANKLQLLNPLGRIVKEVSLQPNASKFEIDVSDLSNGFYIVRVLNGTRVMESAKVVIQQ